MTTASIHDSPLKRGQAALATGDWEGAVAMLQAAVAAEPAEAAAWEALGAACMWLQDAGRAIEAREQAYALYRERGDDRSAARLSLELASDFVERGDGAVANGWFQRARRLLKGLPPAREHALLRIWDAYMALMGECDPASAEARAREAVAIAEEVGAADAGVLALALQGLARVSAGRVKDGMSLLDEAVAGAVAGEITDPQWFYLACCCMIDACDRVRDYGRSLEWCGRLRELSTRWRVQAFLTTCRIKYTAALLWRGEWTACEAELGHAIEELTSANPAAVSGAVVRLAELRRRQGRGAEAEALLAQARTHPLAALVRAALALDAGDTATALDLLDGLLRRTPEHARTERVAALELKTRAHVVLGQLDQARKAAAELEAIAGIIDTQPLRATSLVASGLVASAAAEHESARRCFEDAACFFEMCGSPYESGRVRLDLAACLAALDRVPAAMAEASAAVAALEPIGAAADVRHARELLARLRSRADAAGGPTPRRDGGPGPLTRRQREVLALVAQGLSDREIAKRLFLSEHTVHRHIANILTRLGVSSRAAAVADSLRGNLL